MFGKPAFVSQKGKCVAYLMGTENGIIIWPLCFAGGFSNSETHVLKLVFDQNGWLKRATALTSEGSSGGSLLGIAHPTPEGRLDDAMRLLRDTDKNCPVDERMEIDLHQPVRFPQP